MEKFYIHVKGQYIATVKDATLEEIKKAYPYSEINRAGKGWHVNIWLIPEKSKRK